MRNELSDEELKQARVLATIARDVYNPDPNETESWDKLTDDEVDALGISSAFLNETLSSQIARDEGLRAGLYKTAENELVLAFAGSNLKSTRDWITNIRQGVGLETDEYSKAAMLAKQFRMVSGAKFITGHSKGGAIASLASALTHHDAVTFNTAGLHPKSLEREGIEYSAFKSNFAPGLITNIVVEGEVVQKVNGLAIAPDPLGPIFTIDGETIAGRSSFERHSINNVIEAIDDEIMSREYGAVALNLNIDRGDVSGRQDRRPTVFLIAGPNGAGKSTLYNSIIGPKVSAPFINADIIQKTELRDPSMQASYTARDMAIERREQFLKEGRSFVFETVFSHPSKLKEFESYKAAGFNIVLYHIGLKNSDISVERVQERVRKGGHNVPEDKIRERFVRNQPLIREAALLADRAFIYDNSVKGRAIKLGVEFENGQVVSIGENLLKWQRDLYKNELAPFSARRQNPAAASYDVMRRMAAEVEGTAVYVEVPEAGYSYSGPLIGESSMHYLQKTKEFYVGHFKSVLKDEQKLGKPIEIAYETLRKVKVSHIDLSSPTPSGEKKKNLSQDPADTVKTKTVDISVAKQLLKDNAQMAKKSFLDDKILAINKGDKDAISFAENSLRGLEIGPPLLDTLKMSGTTKLEIPRTPDTPARTVTAILKSAFTEYQSKGLGSEVYRSSYDRDR